MAQQQNGTDKYLTYRSFLTISISLLSIMIIVLSIIASLFAQSVNSSIDTLNESIRNNKEYFDRVLEQHNKQPHPGAALKGDIERIERQIDKVSK